MQKKIALVLPTLIAATNAVLLEQRNKGPVAPKSNPEWFEYRNLLDTDDNGAIDDGELGDELRGRASEEEW